MSDFETLLVEGMDDDIVVVTMNRPDKRNAIDLAMVREMHAVLDAVEEAGTVRALILTGAGEKVFAAGADIRQLKDRTRFDAFRGINQRMFDRLETLHCPTIAAVRGWALGGGCELAMACDLRVAGESAVFGQPEVALGIMPAAGGTVRLARLCGVGVAKDLIFTGRRVPADEALGLGLVNRVVPDDAVMDAARELAGEIASKAPLAVRAAKTSVNAAVRGGADAAAALESTCQAVLFESEDKLEGMSAFLDKRKPEFKGK